MSAEEWDEINAAAEEAADEPLVPDPLTEGVDWIRTTAGDICHPLQHRCSESALALWHACKEHGLDMDDDQDSCDLLSEFQITGAKLAGALNHLAYGLGLGQAGLVVASLKRALGHLHAAQAALEKVAPKKFWCPNRC